MNTSDQNIICIILPRNQGTDQRDQELSSYASSSTDHETNGNFKRFLDVIQDNVYDVCEEKSIITLRKSSESQPNDSINSNEKTEGTTPQDMKSSKKFESKVKLKSKYSDIYGSGDIDFIRRDPKYPLRGKTHIRQQKKTLEKSRTSSAYIDSQTYEQTVGGQNDECSEKSSQHSTDSDKKRCDKPLGEYEPSPKVPKNSHDEDKSDLKLVHFLIYILKYPKTKYHQDCAVDILRHNQKFLKIFQRERQAFGRLKIPVFRKPDKYSQNEMRLEAAEAKGISIQDMHQNNYNDVATTQTLHLSFSRSTSSPASNRTEMHGDLGLGMEFPSANNMLSTADADASSFPIELDDLLMDCTTHVPVFLQNDSQSDEHDRTSTHSKEQKSMT